jgi:S-adenosylmethionine synthetase
MRSTIRMRAPTPGYLTVTGLSAEMGDDGITPGRAVSLEAVAGKNPVGHVGKVYNVLAAAMAGEICEALPEVREASVQLVAPTSMSALDGTLCGDCA